jgi:GTPase
MTEEQTGWTEAELDLSTLDEELLPEGHRSGFVAVVGRPNVGKSTLLNRFLQQKVAIVSPKPQTTRLRQLGILTQPDYQIIFVDTPGWHNPQHPLGSFMVEVAERSIPDADLVLFLVDGSEAPNDEDRQLAELLRAQSASSPVLLAVNKTDLLTAEERAGRRQECAELLPGATVLAISAETGEQCDELLALIVHALPEGPRYYPADQVTDARVRDLAGEIVREQILKTLRHEVPHAIAVMVDEFKERSADQAYVSATIFVERDSQKGIVIGKRGSMLKQIGSAARQEMQRVLGIDIYLDLWVKVRPNWRKRDEELRRFGYYLPGDNKG